LLSEVMERASRRVVDRSSFIAFNRCAKPIVVLAAAPATLEIAALSGAVLLVSR
jgi:hypothetical protein